MRSAARGEAEQDLTEQDLTEQGLTEQDLTEQGLTAFDWNSEFDIILEMFKC
jgi:hypothetical protein